VSPHPGMIRLFNLLQIGEWNEAVHWLKPKLVSFEKMIYLNTNLRIDGNLEEILMKEIKNLGELFKIWQMLLV